MRKTNYLPPDGGWGWVIMISCVLTNFIYRAIQQNFGLLYKDIFDTIDLSGTNVTSIISTNLAVESVVGLVTGPFIKRFKIRKVSVVGAALYCVGLLSTIFSKTYFEFLLGYGVINGAGLGIIKLTARLSINLYFLERRRKVSGIIQGLRSIGSIFIPHSFVLLLLTYGAHGTLLYMTGLALHQFFASLLLQPVEWHLKKVPKNEEHKIESTRFIAENEIQIDAVRSDSFINKITSLFDLLLFKDPKFLIVSFGLMLSVFADVNFSSMFTLILADLKLSNQEIANFVSASYATHIVAVMIIPFIGDFFKRSSRFMYLLGIAMIIVARLGIMYLAGTKFLAAVSIVWGSAAGIRTVYVDVVMADNISSRRLASAESIQMVINGVGLLLGGPFLGLIKDATGSYVSCCHVFNACSMVTISLWSVEMIYSNAKRKRLENINLK